jgi:hypothetical protein
MTENAPQRIPAFIPGFETEFACDHGFRIVQGEAQGIWSDAGFEAEGGQCMKTVGERSDL